LQNQIIILFYGSTIAHSIFLIHHIIHLLDLLHFIGLINKGTKEQRNKGTKEQRNKGTEEQIIDDMHYQ